MKRELAVSTENRSGSQKQYLTHKLLIELLSHQLASPVRWIETQKAFLHETPIIERYVEVGPSRVLANMAKKQAAKEPHADSHTITRQYLSSSENQKEIFYQYEADEPENATNVATSTTKTAPPVESPAPKTVTQTSPPAEAAPVSIVAAATVDDIPMTATDIVIVVVAQKLRKQFDQIPVTKSIQELSGGKSTLQNEIVGDLGTELGSLPDGSEDMPLTALGTALAGAFKGRPGKQVSSLISKLLSSKMPASFNQQAIRQYLSSRWGLGPQRQDTAISYSITLEPASRLTSVDAAKEFFDQVVQRYAAFANFSLTASSAGPSAAKASLVDAEALEAAQKEHQTALAEIYEVIGNLIKRREGEETTETSDDSDDSLREALSHWTSEFGDDMYSGTKPIFDTNKIRMYDAWWNWGRVALIALKQELQIGKPDSNDSKDRIRMILNRWTSTCDDILSTFSTNHGLLNDLRQPPASLQTRSPVFVYTKPAQGPHTKIHESGKMLYEEVPRRRLGQSRSFVDVVNYGLKGRTSELQKPVIQLKQQIGTEWRYNNHWTDIYMNNLITGQTSGLCFSGNTILVTGAGPGSIACDIVRGLLEGGAEVFVTTSRAPPASTTKFFNDMYKTHGSKGSKLTVLPFNQASKQDCEALVNYIYETKDGYRDLDAIIPFAAIGETGQLDGIDAKSELSHRLMLTNLLRILGHVKQQKQSRGYITRPTAVMLPLSPNHGTFGGDGLYSESKLGLETLFNRFHSESWSDYLTICGVVIGWTRGTGLMNTNNVLAESIEAENALTFSPAEMAFSILGLIHPDIMAAMENEPVLADLSGNLSAIQNFKELISGIRQRLSDRSRLQQAIVEEDGRLDDLCRERKLQNSSSNSTIYPQTRRANLQVGYPALSDFSTITSALPNLQGMIDLQRTVVVVGFSELGPWGSSRTRWEMEHAGEFSTGGMLEIAWIMGLIEHFDGDVKGSHYAGWVDSKTKEPVPDAEIASRYGKYVLEHTGIRTIEPEIMEGYDPDKKEFLHEVVMDKDLPTFEASKTTAEAFQLQHGDKVSITPIQGSEDYQVKVKKGARLLIPKAVSFDRKVAGLLPTGWNAATYGIPEDIISQVDPVTLYVLCCVSEAMYSAGIQDPYEIYSQVHMSELANCIGTGAGGTMALRKMYRERYLEHAANSDIFQETFLNTMGAWVNLLLLSSTGPIKTNSGACATAIESLDTGCESILLGKSKMALVGGTDDFREEASYEFANMKATVNTDEEVLQGRSPSEMCRPSTTTRNGFMEAAGCGVQIITTAEMALKMGLPIYAIVAHTQMASDRIGRSIPAPGQGVLTAAREAPEAAESPLLNLEYRRGKLNEAIREIDSWRTRQLQLIKTMPTNEIDDMLQSVDRLRDCKISDARNLWGSNFRQQNPQIAPIRAALAVWGLTVDDIGVASLHGTSTKANDKNEANVINQQMNKLGRKAGNPLLTVSQKWLTGHPKGAAGAWMFNGGMQVLQTGIVPGNRNADNIDLVLQPFEHLSYPSHTIQTAGIKAFMLTSFGFGQKGGLVIGISPKLVFAAITEEEYQQYRHTVQSRQQKAGLAFSRALMTKSLFKPKAESPWKDNENAVLLDPRARASWHTGTSEYIVTV
ncbi:3-oxoacyl-[acyl-carrier-protein] synthase, putative [Talaromyces marneffei ATCC 18224]|uniref:Fatty acid synthase subunit alpha n=1 Tax=Talaromyces marneffei (strain ATCC 18224 / CBS 334.59 / QM 7333) TaxID=441960 RepID=B6QJR4_TALMQ|nr:3-oxoacyl-[acyl-carrier-protein] synthase, putative [Talaromyces marneffei ATCC 18224]